MQATFTLDPASDPDNADDAAVVQAALDALPGPEQPDFGVTLLKGGKDEVLVEAAFAGEPDAVDFFLAGADGYQFGPPERRTEGERLLFSVPILERPEQNPCQGRAALYAGHGRRRGVGNAALPAGRIAAGRDSFRLDKYRGGGKSMTRPDQAHQNGGVS